MVIGKITTNGQQSDEKYVEGTPVCLFCSTEALAKNDVNDDKER